MLLTTEHRAKLLALAAAGDPHAGYWLWHLGPDKDPAWQAQRRVDTCYLNWLASGDWDWMERAKDPAIMVPETFDHNRNRLRQEGIWWTVCWMLLRPHLDVGEDTLWRARLRAMGQEMIDHCRVGDLDECLSYLLAWLLLDRELGTHFMQAEEARSTPAEVAAYVEQVMAPEQLAGGGFFDASTSYFLNTSNILCLAKAALGDAMPEWFDRWAREVGTYLLHAPSADLAIAEQHGDMEHRGDSVVAYYRAPLMWGLAGLGYDPTGALTDLACRLKPAEKPEQLYPMLNHWYMLWTDPEILRPTFVGRDEGKPIALPSCGAVIYHGRKSSAYANLLRLKNDDHGVIGSWLNFYWRCAGENLIEFPGGYGIGNNEPHNHNGVLVKNSGWLWPGRTGLDEVVDTGHGFRASGRLTGPVTPVEFFYYDLGTRAGPNDFGGVELLTELEYHDLEGWWEVRHHLTSPGDTWPVGTENMPVLRQFLHSRREPSPVDRGFRWTTALGQQVQATGPGEKSYWSKEINGEKWWVMLWWLDAPILDGTWRVQLGWSEAPEPQPQPPPMPLGVQLSELLARITVRPREGGLEIFVPWP